MDKIRQVATECVGRAVMFGSLAIGCVMIGLSFNLVSAFRSGALLALAMAVLLMWKAMTAGAVHPKRTEVWLYLDEKSRPAEGSAQRIFAGVMCEVYGLNARISLAVAVSFFLISVILMLFGHAPYVLPGTPQ